MMRQPVELTDLPLQPGNGCTQPCDFGPQQGGIFARQVLAFAHAVHTTPLAATATITQINRIWERVTQPAAASKTEPCS
jgi:hypothetical protein